MEKVHKGIHRNWIEEKGKGKEYLFTKKRIEGNLLPHVLAMYHQREEGKRDWDEEEGKKVVKGQV